MIDSRLVASQLFPPETGASTVLRPRLIERLARGALGQVTLVSGEPASGKTSLLVQWVSSDATSRRSAAWITVAAETDDEVTFWEYLLAAVEALGVAVADLEAALLDGEPPGDAWLTSLANRLGRHKERLVIVIDDLHELEARRALAGLRSLLDMRPVGVSFVIATRVVPPWPLAGWRMAGRLTEINSRDLRVTIEEARELVASCGIVIGEDEVAQLVERTEGWLGGVKLAVLAMQRASDPSRFLARFTADDELVSTYLLRDVVRRQDDDVRQFLLDISVLDALSADLCDATREATDSAELLEQCRAESLFLSRVGEGSITYRLHPLFRELLRAELQLHDHDRFVALHRRASLACERFGNIGQAFHHAVAAGDSRRANELVITHAPHLAHQGRFDELRSWVAILRRSPASESSTTLLALVSALCFSGEGTEALRLLDELEQRPVTEAVRHVSARLRGGAHMVRGEVHLLREVGERLRREATAQRADQPGAAVGAAMFLEGVGTFFEGDLAAAAELLERADRPEFRPAPPAYIAVKSWAALVASRRGDLGHAERCVRAALERRDQLSSGESAAVAMALLTAAERAWEQNRLDEAGELFTQARRSVPPMPWQAVLVECSRSRLTMSRGEPQRALDDLSETGKLFMSGSSSPLLLAQVAERAVDVCMSMGDAEGALGWVHTHDQCRAGDLPWASRIRLALVVEDASLGDLIEAALGTHEPLPRRIDTLLAAALAAHTAQHPDVARSRIADALSLAAPQHMIRRFVDGGPRIASLVGDLVADPRFPTGPAFSRFFAAEVNGACERAKHGRTGPAPVVADLVDQLSARELEVLGLLAKGLSYSEMGEELYVSRNTVKSHVQHVYTKLGAASRAHAVETGRRLGLI